jgi:hypothetical protein
MIQINLGQRLVELKGVILDIYRRCRDVIQSIAISRRGSAHFTRFSSLSFNSYPSPPTIKMHFSTSVSLLALAALSTAAPMEGVKRQTKCASYTIINARGTGEIQGQSFGFRTMNSRVQSAVSGGKLYNVVYPASSDQNSSAGTADIINKITNTLKTNPNECFILEGYSQGAQATVNAMPKLTGANFDAVKGVFLIGNPSHKAGLACNVDEKGGDSTKNVNGLSTAAGNVIPNNWIAKTLDVCIKVRQ